MLMLIIVVLSVIRILIKLKDYKKAENEIKDLLLNEDSEDISAELSLLKARLMEKLNKPTEAAINYELASKYGSPKVSTLALFKLAKFRIRQQDYYEALFTIKRIASNSLNDKMKVFKYFIDGVSTHSNK